MRAINDAFEGADAFRKMLEKTTHTGRVSGLAGPGLNPPEVQKWNAEVDRKRAEKMARRAAKAQR